MARFNKSECNGAATPIDPNVDLFSDDLLPSTTEDREEMQRIPFQEAVGCIMYMAQGTRRDIAHAVGLMSRFNTNHGRVHRTAVKRILRYLSQTRNLNCFTAMLMMSWLVLVILTGEETRRT